MVIGGAPSYLRRSFLIVQEIIFSKTLWITANLVSHVQLQRLLPRGLKQSFYLAKPATTNFCLSLSGVNKACCAFLMLFRVVLNGI